MGRWRPPPEKSSPYITPEGAERLKRELQRLWSSDRREVVRALAAAAAEGDRSENAEYIYRKKQLGEIDRRIRYLGKRLDEIQVIDRVPADRSIIRFGAVVDILNHEGRPVRHRIVGADEIDPDKGWISVDSPVARSLLGKTVGDSVEVSLPTGPGGFEILAVEYPQTR